MRTRHLRSALAALGTAALLLVSGAGPAASSEPSSGTVSSASPSVIWSGGPLAFTTFGTGCEPAGASPTCDVFDLTVGALAPDADDVVISVAADHPSDILSLYVYGPDGALVAEDTNLTANPRVTLRGAAAGAYSVRVEALLSTSGLPTYRALAAATEAGPAPDEEVPCTGDDAGLGPPPDEVLQAALDDDGRPVRLDVLVLLDGVEEAYARAFFEKVALPYAELNIQVAPVFEVVPAGAITSDVTTEIIEQTKALVPDRRVPDEFDVVELLTHRDIEALGQKAVAGQAECIGGVAYKEHGFNVSEAGLGTDPAGIAFGPLTLVPEQAAKITAHEIGHLFGGQHHFANCVEGIRGDALSGGDSSPCSLMFNSADFMSLHFGTVNGRIIRGYGLVYAAANDARPAPATTAQPTGEGEGSGGAGEANGDQQTRAGQRRRGTLPATGASETTAAALAAAAASAVLLLRRAARRTVG